MRPDSSTSSIRRLCRNRINSTVLLVRHLPLVNCEPATRDASDQVQECASEEADSNLTTTLNFSFESLIFPVLLRMQLSTEPPSSKGAMDGVQGSQGSMTTARTTMGATVIQHYVFEGGCLWKCEHVRWTPCMFPAGRAVSAEGGMAVHRGDAKWSCPY